MDVGGPGREVERQTSVVALSELLPDAPIVVLAHRKDPATARGAMAVGAEGYIPMSMGFDLAVEVLRFTLAEALMSLPNIFWPRAPPSAPAIRATDTGALTAREMLVVRAI